MIKKKPELPCYPDVIILVSSETGKQLLRESGSSKKFDLLKIQHRNQRKGWSCALNCACIANRYFGFEKECLVNEETFYETFCRNKVICQDMKHYGLSMDDLSKVCQNTGSVSCLSFHFGADNFEKKFLKSIDDENKVVCVNYVR